MRRAALLCLLLALAGCGGGDNDGQAASATSSSAAAPSANRDAGTLSDLCNLQCSMLISQEVVCPVGTTNMLTCVQALARGADRVQAVVDGAASLDRSDPERYEDLDRAIADAQDAYDTWSDHTTCLVAYDINDPTLASITEGGALELQTCALEGQMAAITQSDVGAVLRNFAEGHGDG